MASILKIDLIKQRRHMEKNNLKKMILTAIFAAIAVIGSGFSFPVMGSKCAPVQHLINIMTAVLLGPVYAVLQAFIASSIRNFLSLGTLLAFPGAMFGALLAGLCYRYIKKLWAACLGEVVGTGIIGGLVAFPVAAFLMSNNKVAFTTFVIPFLISSVVGTIIAAIVLSYMDKSGSLEEMKKRIG